jgi:hypothetical protein
MSFPHYKILIATKLNIIYKHLLSYTANPKKKRTVPNLTSSMILMAFLEYVYWFGAWFDFK